MKISGQNTVAAPVQQVWDALLDPAVLVRTIPGCERLEETGDHVYAMTVSAGVAAIKGTYDGTCALSDLDEPASLTMKVQGAGAPGTIGATVATSSAESQLMMAPSPSRPARRSIPDLSAATRMGTGSVGTAPRRRTDSLTPPGMSMAEAIVALSPMARIT